MLLRRGSDSISPTAHYTGQVWARNGLGDPALATVEGRLLHTAVRPVTAVSAALGGPALEGFLLARHRVLDALLEEEVAAGRVGQIVEVACGMSPRGLRFARRHGDAITYIEGDLPAMAARKRRALARAGGGGPHHRVVDLDALRDGGPGSLAEVTAALDPSRGLAIVTEGLLNYFDRPSVEGLWRRFAHALAAFPSGRYVSDLHLAQESGGAPARLFTTALGVFVRGRVHLHFADVAEAESVLRDAGFGRARLVRAVDHPAGAEQRDAPGAGLVRIVDAAV